MEGLKQPGKPSMVMVEGALPLRTLAPLASLGSELQKENETYINAVNHFKALFYNLPCGRVVNLAGDGV